MPTPVPAVQTQAGEDRIDPWKDDGNIVLATEGKYFRVHRSILSAHSGVFKDMFEGPHSDAAEKEFIEGCPVVRLHDTSTDLQIVLRAIYERSYPVLSHGKMPISVVSSFLRLGEKYAIPMLVEEAKVKLYCSCEPTSLSGASLLIPGRRFVPLALFPEIDGDPHNFQIMNLLEEMGLKKPLPMAMYQCIITCPVAKVTDGYQDKGSLYSLSPASLKSFIRLKDVLERYQTRLASVLCGSAECTLAGCTANIRYLWANPMEVVAPFSDWQFKWDSMFCAHCRGSLKAKREAEMKRAWDQIPPAFGFDSWAEVKKSGDFPGSKTCLLLFS